ncbi:hypothetical protein FB45DRAFT_889699 [Roridomyces roridus]|uniref:Uncharacterized protein n=1 Tax=Roridomyces roridus TaxID=1738132 RepID=A0AAD7CKJ2_9AGAR|nr:hypothetical protein FB45DRAFT_889699 [Roridomyces roridus]
MTSRLEAATRKKMRLYVDRLKVDLVAPDMEESSWALLCHPDDSVRQQLATIGLSSAAWIITEAYRASSERKGEDLDLSETLQRCFYSEEMASTLLRKLDPESAADLNSLAEQKLFFWAWMGALWNDVQGFSKLGPFLLGVFTPMVHIGIVEYWHQSLIAEDKKKKKDQEGSTTEKGASQAKEGKKAKDARDAQTEGLQQLGSSPFFSLRLTESLQILRDFHVNASQARQNLAEIPNLPVSPRYPLSLLPYNTQDPVPKFAFKPERPVGSLLSLSTPAVVAFASGAQTDGPPMVSSQATTTTLGKHEPSKRKRSSLGQNFLLPSSPSRPRNKHARRSSGF